LFRLLKLNPEIGIRLAEPIVPRDTPEGARLYRYAENFFEREAQTALVDGTMVPATNQSEPFFIPVDVQARHEKDAFRFAFLEGRGEWYTPNKDPNGPLYLELRPEIVDLLENYNESLSIIFVAPYAIGASGTADTEASDAGLVGAIKYYLRDRTSMLQDNHLYLLTKWDLYADPRNEVSEFSEVEPEQVERVIESRYPQSWPAFQAMPLGGDHIRRSFMQYSAGLITGGLQRKPAQHQAEVFDRYPKLVWNWLVGNASQVSETPRATGLRVRRMLFPDIAPPAAERVTVWRRVVSFVLMRD
jgi:hypothetical protein